MNKKIIFLTLVTLITLSSCGLYLGNGCRVCTVENTQQGIKACVECDSIKQNIIKRFNQWQQVKK